ncbi:YebC/PmpR family DNA-binding transcriptional regulator [Mycoplasma todarodis]|uniref:Probable transcriptional regulatory protein C4B25_02555 n=1 Tax=Mycoplasma todarodis TaxID=1937191 RepID=A0A4R0XTM8_9MOLU|nr:YebC/PmpR family DNA-binding transcriptional regulator [Mycoplasma todarodis]TCG10999.1 YebC/PmpR family DNA-binding transcriptional regulator [Mycoplasma todarodis]
MAGHSKWANIKHRKAAQDSARSKIFAKFSKEIMVAAAAGGGDINTNAPLKLAVQKAKAKSMPAKNIQKAIDKATGVGAEGAVYKESVYEGYLPGGISILVMCLSDNHNRVSASVKSLFNKSGGSLGKNGSVSFLFDRKGVLELPLSVGDEDTVMMLALEAGASDFEMGEESYFITTEPTEFSSVKDALEKEFEGVEFKTAEVTYEANTHVKVDADKAQKILDAVDKFEDDEDIQEVFHNLDPESFE